MGPTTRESAVSFSNAAWRARSAVRIVFSVVANAMFIVTPAFADCVVRGTSVPLAGVRVQPPDAPGFFVDLNDSVEEEDAFSVTAKPRSDGARTDLEVEGAIAFRGRRSNIWYSLRVPVQVDRLLLHMEPGARLVDARVVGSAMLGSIVLDSGGASPSIGQRPRLVAGPVRVPCSDLTLDDIPDEVELPVGGDDTWWTPRAAGHRVGLRAAPDHGAPTVYVSLLERSDELSLERVEERGEWLLLGHFGERALVGGWVRRSEWTPASTTQWTVSRDEAATVAFSSLVVPPRYEGPAEIAAGTPIYVEPGRGKWATVKRRTGFNVRDDGSHWIELTYVAGVAGASGAELGAYVPRSAVQFPPEAH